MNISDIPPSLYTIIAEALGVFVAEKLRLNQQNSVGNWFELFGQVILTYSAQQQLIQQGPGALPGKPFNKELAEAAANEPLGNFAHLISQNALTQPEVQQELVSNQDGITSYTAYQPTQQQAAAPVSVAAPAAQIEIDSLKQQVASLSDEILQLKEMLYYLQTSIIK